MKHNKLFAVLAMAATLALSACGGAGSSAEHVHTAADNAPWQHDNNYHWKDCKDNDGGKVDNTKHTFGEGTVITAATCENKGKEKVKCTVCGAEVERDIPALNHLYAKDADNNDIVTWTKEATCEEGGEGTKTCTRPGCGHVEPVTSEKLNHLYAQDEEGNDIVQWTKQASCDEGGEGTKACTRPGCTHIEPVTTDPLGHKFVLNGTPTEPEPGKAAVQIYTCENGCGQSRLGFRANEVSAESKTHLNFTEPNEKGEIGASFWGRPIGNALALNADGSSVNRQNNECVYCSTETGDFFEYVFDLTQKQVDDNGLDNCYLYVDAKPADYLNGGDFFAYNASADDWTPGYYIDGADEHVEMENDQPVMVADHAQSVRGEDGAEAEGVALETQVKMGKRITDYRYILYVDNQVVSFDDSIRNPTHGNNTNMTREEFQVPYAFSLHEGTNRISLRMAGGYRSTFYNFTFKANTSSAD